MCKATWTTAKLLGLTSGLAAIEHGIFEVLRGNARPESVVIVSMGPPCEPEAIWNACEPAMTIVPNVPGDGHPGGVLWPSNHHLEPRFPAEEKGRVGSPGSFNPLPPLRWGILPAPDWDRRLSGSYVPSQPHQTPVQGLHPVPGKALADAVGGLSGVGCGPVAHRLSLQ
jgi:hypothetical protein